MSPRTEEQFKEIRKQKRELIMNAALEEFAENGYHASSITAVAKRAKISKGLIYNYFESKEELLKNIIMNGFDVFVKEFDPNKDGFLTEDEFDYFIDRVFELLKENISFWRLYFSVLMKAGVAEIIKESMIEFLDPFLKTMLDYYERHKKKNPFACAVLFGAVLDGVTLNFVMEPNMFPLEDIKKLLKEKLR